MSTHTLYCLTVIQLIIAALLLADVAISVWG